MNKDIVNDLEYDPISGTFIWLTTHPHPNSNMRAGNHAGSYNNRGYLQIYYKGKSYKAHRLAYYLIEGKEPEGYIDHVDGNPMNNKWENLRLCNAATNSYNKRVSKNSISGIKGLRELPSGSFFGTITKGSNRYTFCSKDKEAVIEWLSETRKELHKDFARN